MGLQKEALQLIELLFEKRGNIICGIIYRQHNSPESFQAYFNEALERFSLSDKAVYIMMVDFNINLLNAETCNYTKDFLLGLQSYTRSSPQSINQLGYIIPRPR